MTSLVGGIKVMNERKKNHIPWRLIFLWKNVSCWDWPTFHFSCRPNRQYEIQFFSPSLCVDWPVFVPSQFLVDWLTSKARPTRWWRSHRGLKMWPDLKIWLNKREGIQTNFRLLVRQKLYHPFGVWESVECVSFCVRFIWSYQFFYQCCLSSSPSYLPRLTYKELVVVNYRRFDRDLEKSRHKVETISRAVQLGSTWTATAVIRSVFWSIWDERWWILRFLISIAHRRLLLFVFCLGQH